MKRVFRWIVALTLCAAFALAGCAKNAAPPPADTDYDAIVIGAGMGGLSAAAHMATGGLKVLVLEQHHKVGGCTSSFSRGDFNFDAALHEMTGGAPGTPMGRLLEKADVARRIELIRIPDLYRSFFPGGVDVTYPGDPELAIRALSQRWPAERENIRAFHDQMRRVHEEAESLGEMYRMSTGSLITRLIKAPSRQPTLFKYFRSELQPVLDAYFDDPALKAVISQFWVYYGPPPSKLWAVMFMSANWSYLTDGAYQIKGSSQALSDAYRASIEDHGGTVRTGTRVTRVLVEDGRASGVKTQWGETFKAKYVVSNANPFQTFFGLVGKDKTPKKMARKLRGMEPSVSLVGVYLGLDVPPSFWNCTDHEMFLNKSLNADVNYRKMVEGDYRNAAAAITFYTNLGDPFYSPPGKSVLVLHAYSDIDKWPKEREAYLAHKEKVGDDLIALAEEVFPGLSEHIEVREMITPRSIQAFTSQYKGIPYGWDFTVKQGIHIPNQTPLDGLYLAGSWTNPGHGVSTAQISGYQAARLILDEEGL